MSNLLEVLGTLAVLIVAIAAPRLGLGWMRRMTHRLRRLANRRRLAVATIAAASFTANGLVGLLIKIPDPAIHDEFSYLLAADTFAHGRLTNPTHPYSRFFKTYQVLQQPTYQSKYPPGQGLALAFGQTLCGSPIVGVWLSVAVGCGLVCWMLQGWLPPRWALLGGILVALGYGVVTCWGQSYWGGGVAMAGGALLFGALPRIISTGKIRHSLAMGLGLAILANSRPYEGLVASLPVAAVLLSWCIGRRGPTRKVLWQRLALPLAIILTLTAAWMALYNFRVTGDPCRMPYQVWHQQLIGDSYLRHTLIGNAIKPDYIDSPSPPVWEKCFSMRLHTSLIRKLLRQWGFYMSPALIPALFMLPLAYCGRGFRLFLIAAGLVLLAVLMQGTAAHTHYTAPVAPLIFGLFVQGMRRLSVWRWQGRPSGRLFVFWLPVVYALGTIAALSWDWSAKPYPTGHAWSLQRAAVQRELNAHGGEHLVFVRYGPRHISHFEWVYNAADIDRAKVVWAHDLGDQENRLLRAYYSQRQVWRLDADAVVPLLRTDPMPNF